MREFTIGVYPGDGIGRDVIDQAVRVLDHVTPAGSDFSLKMTELPWGAAFWREHREVVPPNFLEILRPLDAILLGAVGWPEEIPDHITLAPLVKIRQAFDQYACVRPARLLPGVQSVLRDKRPNEIDLVVVRENSEGEYVNQGGRFRRGTADECAIQTAIHTRRGIERILHFGFKLAARRRRELTMITKSNAMRYGYVLWDEILEEIAPLYPEVQSRRLHCDAAAMNLVRCPESFDVIVASNLFGDLLTDLAGAISGGLGLAPSTNTNPERVFPSMFEPVHGSAPDIAGQGIANPIAAILSAAMMLEHLEQPMAAGRIINAVQRTLSEGHKTRDLGGQLSTVEMGNHIVANLDR